MNKISLTKSIIFTFLLPFLICSGLVWGLIPFLLAQGIPQYFLEGPLYALYFSLLITAALIAASREADQLSWTFIRKRFRLKPLSLKEGLWVFGLLVFSIVTYLGLEFTVAWIKGPLIQAPDWLERPGHLFGISIKGN